MISIRILLKSTKTELKLRNNYIFILILNIFHSEKPKVNPIMYKEYLVRYPAYSIPLVIQMIDSVSSPDVKLHKKVNILIASLI